MWTLSYCMGKPVYIRQEQFRKCLMAGLNIVESSGRVHLFLSDHSVFHPHADIDMFIWERKAANPIVICKQRKQGEEVSSTAGYLFSPFFHTL